MFDNYKTFITVRTSNKILFLLKVEALLIFFVIQLPLANYASNTYEQYAKIFLMDFLFTYLGNNSIRSRGKQMPMYAGGCGNEGAGTRREARGGGWGDCRPSARERGFQSQSSKLVKSNFELLFNLYPKRDESCKLYGNPKHVDALVEPIWNLSVGGFLQRDRVHFQPIIIHEGVKILLVLF